jgi:sulfur transfer complex TusBCD TusB component (DsrH family)
LGEGRVKVLHLVRRPDDAYAMEMIAAQLPDHDVSVAFLQDGVYRPTAPVETRYVVEEDCVARGVEPDAQTITHEQLVDLIFESDRVVTW